MADREGGGFDRVEHMRRSVEELWNHGDVEGFMEPFTDDAVLAPQAGHPDDGPLIHGKEAITRFFRRIHRPVVYTSLVAIRDAEVLASFRWVGSARAEGDDWFLLYRFAGRSIVQARYYERGEDARRAAGQA